MQAHPVKQLVSPETALLYGAKYAVEEKLLAREMRAGGVQAGGLKREKGNTDAQVLPFRSGRSLGQDNSATPRG